MKSSAWFSSHKISPIVFVLAGLLLIIVIPLAANSLPEPSLQIRDMELISVGRDGVQGDSSSYHLSTPDDGRFAAFISTSKNWTAPNPDKETWLNVFVRDRVNDKLSKITYGLGGKATDQDSLDPVVTADGRYISYFSYATNLVPDDTNGHEWLRQGIDVFMYDMQSKGTKRVSLNSAGLEIDGNSVGMLTPDGRSVLFVSNGRVITEQSHSEGQSAVYLRDLQTGKVEQISKGVNDLYPNGVVDSARGSFDGRYIVYAGEATNLVQGDRNGVRDLFLNDRTTGDTKLFTRDPNGKQANGFSNAPQITHDDRYIVFHSLASNLVPGDTNGLLDIFIYDVQNNSISRVNVTENGTQANGLSKDPSICNTGRFVSYTTEATNLVPGDTNGQRDVIIHDLLTGRNTVATVNESGELGNGRAHLSFLVPDCTAITFASESTNLISGDENGVRDLFMARISYPADFGQSTLTNQGISEPGDILVYTYTVRNIGTESSPATLVSIVPTNTTYLEGSATGGAIFKSSDNQVEWREELTGESESSFSYAVTVDASLVDPTLIANQSTLTSNEHIWLLNGYTMVNGLNTYFPIMISN